MNKYTNRIIAAILGYILSLMILLVIAQPEQAEAAQKSRISAAKGKGVLSLARKWNNRYIRKSANKYKDNKEILGYYTKDWPTDTLSHDSLVRNAEKITGIATFSYKINASGSLEGETPRQALEVAKDENIEVLALVHNLDSSGFNRTLIHSIFSNPKLSSNAINNIYKVVDDNGFDGVNIDFENIPPGDRQALNDFLTELAEKFRPMGYIVTISVPAKTADSPSNAWSGAFDYEYLGQVADRIMLMTYDEHWFGGAPGPVASSPWVENVVKYSSSLIPKDKLLLGIGNYGYDWVVGKGGYKSVPAKNALELAGKYGAKIIWDDYFQTPYFYYWKAGQKHVVWFESVDSASFKVQMVEKYYLRGIAVWRLGFESWDFFDMVSNKLN